MGSRIAWVFVVVASIALGAAAVVGVDALRSDESAPATVVERFTPSPDGNVAQSLLNDVADLYAEVNRSVVQINGASSRSGSSGLGSGVVLDKDGRILTNFHVVDGFDRLDVLLPDGTGATAQLVGSDPGDDLAVIQVDLPANKLFPVKLGDSDKVRAGELVIAVGNPFGIEGTVTQGIVSGVGRTLSSGGGGRPLRQLIQSDASINPGNSGGGLFNGKGELIGITTAIENPSGDRVFVGIGYAVPINTARRFLPDMLANRPVEHPRMGVGLQNLTPALAGQLGLDVQQGVLITTIETGSAAERASLRGGARRGAVGDVITAIEDKAVKTYEDLANYIDSRNVGDRVTVKIVRDGREMTIDVTLEAWRSN